MKSAVVSLENKTATVTGSASVDSMVQAIEDAGKRASLRKKWADQIYVFQVTKMPCGGCKKRVREAVQVSTILSEQSSCQMCYAGTDLHS